MRRWGIVIALVAMASVADAQTACEGHCHEREGDCEATCRARDQADRGVCIQACRVEERACTAMCDARGR